MARRMHPTFQRCSSSVLMWDAECAMTKKKKKMQRVVFAMKDDANKIGNAIILDTEKFPSLRKFFLSFFFSLPQR